MEFDLGRVKNMVGKGENAGYQNFFHHSGLLNIGTVWQKNNQFLFFIIQGKMSFEKIVEEQKGDNAGNLQILLFSHVFQTCQKQKPSF